MSWTIPQQQESQNAPAHLQERLFDELRTLAGVDVGPSRISVPGARGLHPARGLPDEQAFLVPQVGEFAHLHPAHDGSLHLVLPPDLAADVVTQGWGRPHMWAGTRLSPGFMMVLRPARRRRARHRPRHRGCQPRLRDRRVTYVEGLAN